MSDRPILFSGPMVRALLDGTKTQTRRIVKLTDSGRVKAVGSFSNWHLDDYNATLACPFGQPGDRLWVRETWGIYDDFGIAYGYPSGIPQVCPDGFHASYPADDNSGIIAEVFKWRPSIHMPRWASRITLEIVSVRVERLNRISVADAIAEGVSYKDGAGKSYYPPRDPKDAGSTPCFAYKSLWESINGPGSWAANPWVWVVEFKVVEGGEG